MGWRKVSVDVQNPIVESPDYRRWIHLLINYCPGYPAHVQCNPEDSYPSEPPQYEIIDAFYADGRPVPIEVVNQIADETLYQAMQPEADYADRDNS